MSGNLLFVSIWNKRILMVRPLDARRNALVVIAIYVTILLNHHKEVLH